MSRARMVSRSVTQFGHIATLLCLIHICVGLPTSTRRRQMRCRSLQSCVDLATQEECLALKTRVERAVERSLKAGGDFYAQRGSFEFGFVGDEEVLDCEKNNCAFTNPKSPYGLAILPLSKGENFKAKYNDPRTPSYAIEGFDAGGGKGDSRIWQLRSDEVVLSVGCTPPAVASRYFAFTGYLFELYDRDREEWVSTFGSLQDSIGIIRNYGEDHGTENRLKTSAAWTDPDEVPEERSAFNKLTLVMMGASKRSLEEMQKRIRKALMEFQIGDIVNVIVISKPFLENVGLEVYDNYYSLIVRNIVPSGGEDAFKDYAGEHPLSAWRITPKKGHASSEEDLFDMPPLVPRHLPRLHDGLGFEAPFAQGLETLIDQIEKTFQQQNVVAHAIGTGSSLGLLNVDSGIDCVQRKLEICNGDNRDAQYLSTYPFMLLDNDEKFAFVVGVNHRVAGLVVYSNTAVSDVQVKLGVRSIDDEEMIGSADAWLKGTHFEDMSQYFYAIRFSRHCDGAPYCTEIPSMGPRAVPFDRAILVSSRLYVNAETGVGPSPDDIVMPHTMIFTPRGKHTSGDVRDRISQEQLRASTCMSHFLSLTLCTGGLSAECCNGVISWTEQNCFCDDIGKMLLETLPPSTGERGIRVLSMICGKPALDRC